jgi:hypothetical protein
MADGRVEIFDFRFESSFPEEGNTPEEIRAALAKKEIGAAVAFGNGIVQLIPEGQYRVEHLVIEPVAAKKVFETPLRLVAHTIRPSGPLVCALGGTPDSDCALVPENRSVHLTNSADFRRPVCLRGTSNSPVGPTETPALMLLYIW